MPNMRAVQVSRPGGPLELVERPIPDPGPGSVRIKVQACGICHSDVTTKEGQWPGITFPRVPGLSAGNRWRMEGKLPGRPETDHAPGSPLPLCRPRSLRGGTWAYPRSCKPEKSCRPSRSGTRPAFVERRELSVNYFCGASWASLH
jgi:hypothetical protein